MLVSVWHPSKAYMRHQHFTITVHRHCSSQKLCCTARPMFESLAPSYRYYVLAPACTACLHTYQNATTTERGQQTGTQLQAYNVFPKQTGGDTPPKIIRLPLHPRASQRGAVVNESHHLGLGCEGRAAGTPWPGAPLICSQKNHT